MTELDLSLLADDERKDAAPHLEGCVHYLPPIPDGEDMWLEQRFDMHEDEPCTCANYERTRLADALITARAENKRKDEVIAKLINAAEQGRTLLRQMAEISSMAGRRGAHERADAIDAVLREARALFQSEKGGE